MLTMWRYAHSLAIVVCLGLLTGCGENRNPSQGLSKKDHLDEIGQMLKGLTEENRKPPTRLAELEAVEPMLPLASPLLRSGELVYVWGADYSPGSQKIAAYEKKAATEGGWVLLQDGTVKEMTADEFRAAPKAK
jgi:hypothetical protein